MPIATPNELERDVVEIVTALAPDRSGPITPATTLVDDLGYDSARLLELGATLERRFGCVLDDSARAAAQTVAAVVDLVATSLR